MDRIEKLQRIHELQDPSYAAQMRFARALEIIPTIKGEKGDKGDKGEAGRNGVDGIDGKDGERGETGPQGVPGKIGKPGVDGKEGEPGVAGPQGVPGKDAALPKIKELVTRVLAEIDTESYAKDKDFKELVEFLRRGGFRGGGSSTGGTTGTAVYNEVVGGSGTAWTLLHFPLTGTLRLFANGQRLTPTVDYTNVGAAITTLTAWASGTLLADYTF